MDSVGRGRVKLPPHIAARVAETAADLSPRPPGHIDREAREHGAIALTGTIGSIWLLRPDGELFDVDADLGKPLTPLPEHLHVTAIVLGCERYPWLRELLPPRPATARDCSRCAGCGMLGGDGQPGAGVPCDACHALGWVTAA